MIGPLYFLLLQLLLRWKNTHHHERRNRKKKKQFFIRTMRRLRRMTMLTIHTGFNIPYDYDASLNDLIHRSNRNFNTKKNVLKYFLRHVKQKVLKHLWQKPTAIVLWEGHLTDKSDDKVGHLNTILVQGSGNLNDPIFKSSNTRGLLGVWGSWSFELIGV